MAWQPPKEDFDNVEKSGWSPPKEDFDNNKTWSPPKEDFDDSPTKIEDVDKLKELQSTGQKLTDKQQRILFKADDERSFLDKVSRAASSFIPAATEIIGQTATGAGEFVNDVAIQPLLLSVGDSLNDTEKAKQVKAKQGLALRSLAVGAAKDVEETANAAVRFAMFGSATTDKLLGKSEEERFRAWQDREVMREQERQSLEANPDRAAYLLSQNPLIQGYVEYEAKKMGLSPEEVEKVKQDYIQTMLDQGLTKDQINQNISALGEFVSPVSIPGAGRVGKITNEYVGKALSKVAAPVSKVIGNLPARAIEKTAGGIELGANKVLQGTEFVQTVSKKIGEYAINDPDTWIKGTANTAVLPVVAVAKPTKSVARVVKDIARQVDVGGTAGRRGMLERAGGDALSSDLTQRLFGPQGKGGVARAKIGDWVIRQSNAIVQPGVHAAAMNVVMGLPDIETAEDLGFSAGTGFGIGGLSGTRAIERAETLVDPRKTMAEKITEIVTPDPTAYRRDEDADIKRFMAQASPEIQKNIADLSDIQKRKAAVDATIASLEKERDAQINPDDAAFRQKQIDGFLKQKEALSKATPETQAEATRQTTLAFIDAYDLAQSTGGVAGLRGVNIAVLDPANADQFFRDLYGDSLKQAETTVNLLTGIPSLTETDSTKLTEARQLLQRFQTDVEGAKSARGFALQEDNTDPNSAGFVPPHLRRINQQGATAVVNADLIKHMTSQGLNLRHTLQHEVQHAVQQFAEVNKMLAPIRGQLFDQKIKNDDGSVEVYQQGYYSDEDLDRYATQYAKMMSPSDNGASFYAQFGGEVEKMRAYIKDEILAETAAATGEYAGGTRAALDDVGRNVMDWFEVKTKSGRLKQLKETLRKNGILFDNAGGYSAVLGAQMSPETLAMVRQYQRGLKDFDGTMTVQQSRESDEPDIPLTKVLGSVALQNKYRHADFFEKEQIIKATAPDGSVTEIVVPAGAKIDPFIDVYRTQGGQLVDANGNVVTLGPEITFGSMPDGTTFETDTRIARKSNGSPIILTNREMKARARERTKIIQTAIDSAKNDGSGVRLADTGNGNYRGVMSPAQIEAFMALPNEVVSPNLKRMTKFFNELMARNDGTRVVMEYQAALLNGKYKALSPKIRDEVPIGFQITQDGNFALTTISVSRLYDKMQAWADKKPENLQPWNGDTGAFWDSLIKLLDNHSRGEKGETGLHPDAYIAGKMKNKINDLFNAYNAETKQSNPDRSTLPRARGKDNLDIVIRSRRLDRINNFSESPSQKLPINYGYLTTNYMPVVNPMAAPMTAEEVQNRFDGSVTATRVRRAMATGEVDALESELRQMDDLLPTESLQLVQGEDQMPRIQIVSMFDPENVASLEPEEIVSDIDAETEAELAILDAQDGTVPPQDIAKVLSAKLDQLYADGGRSPIIPVLETELEKIYQELESQAQEQEAATEDFEEAPEITDVDVMNSPMDMIEQAVILYNSGRVDSDPPETFAEYVRGAINGTGNLIISPDVTDEQIVAAANDVMQYRQSLKDRIQSGTRFENAVVAPAGLQYLPAFHASRADFDKFNLNFINSGNREQVYGWGLYFAENKKEIDKFVPLQYQYKVDLDIDENKILDWNSNIDSRLRDKVDDLKKNIEIDTAFPVRIDTVGDYYDALSEYIGNPKEASMQLKAMGFDGIKFTDRITQTKQKQIGLTAEQITSVPKTYNYVIFDDSKIKILDKGDKSLGPITQFMPAGEVEAPSGERGFQSKLQTEIQRKFKGANATPEQLKAVLGNPQNVKAEEVKWSGVLDAIDRIAGENNGKVPVAELMDYLRNEGQVKFEEVTLGKDRSVEDIADTYRIKIEDQYGEAAFYDEFDDPLEFDELPFALQNAINNASKLPEPRFAEYQLPGGENYREVVMAMPKSKEFLTKSELDEYEKLRFETENRTPEQQARLDQLFIRIDENNAASRDDKSYTSSHFPNVPNYVAHMRLNERTDAQGNEGLFVEEFQSDRHQAGREKGYEVKEELFKPAQIKQREDGKWGFWKDGTWVSTWFGDSQEAAVKRQQETYRAVPPSEKIKTGIPDAPFRKDWSLQLFKRALRDAVESGKQWIGWTTGDTQAERYDLSKQVDRVEVTANNRGTVKGQYTLNIYGLNGERILSDTMPIEKVSETVGKELAEKIFNQEPGTEKTYQSQDFKVGGEGMKGFYDTILPKEIGKYVAKMGGKVEKSEIAKSTQENIEKKAEELARENGILPDEESLEWLTGRDRNRFIEEAEQELNLKPIPIWRVNITPEMANVVSAGQLQFMPAVPAELDFEYSELAKKPDYNRWQLQQMVDWAAKKAGYDITKVYHGTVADIKIPRGELGVAAHISRSKKFAEDWANTKFTTGERDIKPPKVYEWYIKGEIFDPRNNKHLERIKGDFYKSIKSYSGSRVFKEEKELINKSNWKYEDYDFFERDDVLKSIKDAGFDGYEDREGKLWQWGKNLAIFDPNNIKSADPVTRDDQGNVIPLSQRFQTTSPDIRYMPAGEGLPLSDATAPERQQQVEKPLGMVALPNAQNISPEQSKFISEKPLKKFDALGDKNATQVNADNMKYPVNPIPDSVALPGRWGLVNAKITGMPKAFKEVGDIIDRQINRLIRLLNANPEFAKESARFYRDMAESATMITDAAFPQAKGKEKFLFDELVLRFLALGSPRTSVAANASKSAGSVAALIDEFEAGYKIGFGEQSHGAKTTYNAWKDGGHFDLSLPGVQDKVRSFYLNSLAELIEMAEAQNDTASVEELMVRAGKSMRVIDPNNSTQLTDVEKKEIQRLLDGKATIDMWDMAAKGWAWPGYIIFKNRRNAVKQPFQWSQDDFEKTGTFQSKNWKQIFEELKLKSPADLRYQQARALKIDGNPDWTRETWDERKLQPFPDSTKFSYYTQGTESGLSPGGGGPLYDAQQSIDGLLADRLNELGLAPLFGKTKLKARNSQEILWALEKLDNPIEANNDLSLFGSTFEPFLNEVLKFRKGKDIDPKSRAENVLAAMERAYAAMAQQLIPIEVVSGGTSEEAKRIQDAIQALQNAGDADAATTLTLHVADGLGNAINDLAIKHGIKATIENVDVGEGGYTENQQVNVAPNIRVTLRGKPTETFLVLETLSRAMDQDGGNVIRKPTMRELNDSRVNKNLILTIPTTGLDQAQRNKMFLDLSALKDANGNLFLTGFTEVEGGIAIGNQFYNGDYKKAISDNKTNIDGILKNYNQDTNKADLDIAIIQTFFRGQASTKIEPEKIMVKKKEVVRPSFASDLYDYIKNRMTDIPLAGSRPSFAQKTDFEKNWIDKADTLFSRLKSYPIGNKSEIKKAKLEAPDISTKTKITAALVALKSELETALLRDQISEDVANKLKSKYGFKEEKQSKEEE